MQQPASDSANNPDPTYTAPGIAINGRVNGVQQRLSHESRARCLAWRDGCVLENTIDGLLVRRERSGRVIASGLYGFQAVIDAYESGELSKAVTRA